MTEFRRHHDAPLRPDGLESTDTLLSLVRAGDNAARDRLIARYLPALRRWAHGRLPAGARGLMDTDDLVQDTVIRALNQVNDFESRREGSFLAYLRRIVVNHVMDQIRRNTRGPGRASLPTDLPDLGPSPVERAIGAEALVNYQRALATLSTEQQEAVMMRVEMGFSHQQIAVALGSPSADAARMLIARALVRLARVMKNKE